MKTFAGEMNGFVIFAIVLGIFALIAIVAFVIYRFLKPKLKEQETPKTEKDYAQEELDRRLEPVDDEQARKAIEDYKPTDDED